MIFDKPKINVIQMVREIHPIGQGAFYSENFRSLSGRHYKALVVYDCGTTKKNEKERLREEIDRLPKNKDVDILFISHFDQDHVCGIKWLMEGRKIKRVVIPQITGFEWFYIVEDACVNKPWNSFHVNSNLFDTISLLSQTEGVEVIEVRPIDYEDNFIADEQQVDNKNDGEEIGQTENNTDIARLLHPIGKSTFIISGDVIHLNDTKCWEYMPINYTFGKDIVKLRIEINVILHDELFNRGHRSIDEVPYNDVCSLIEPHLNHINKTYRKIFGNSNASSMCLYSGGISECGGLIDGDGSAPFGEHSVEIDQIEDGCLYTGDSSLLNNRRLDYLLSKINYRGKRIGSFQLPHHGSYRNFSKETFEKMKATGINPIVVFMSYGSKNRYRHPSKKLVKVMLSECAYNGKTGFYEGLQVCGVNENSNTLLLEIFLIQL